MKYQVNPEDYNTSICEIEDKFASLHGGLVDTWEEAKKEACEYLRELIGRCQQTLIHFEGCDSYQDHNGSPPGHVIQI